MLYDRQLSKPTCEILKAKAKQVLKLLSLVKPLLNEDALSPSEQDMLAQTVGNSRNLLQDAMYALFEELNGPVVQVEKAK